MCIEKSKVIGIVGGMGPQAGIALYERILVNSKVTTDQQHLAVILMAFPDIVDRSLFLSGQTSVNPAYEIANVIKKVAISGAQLIGIACNTSHAPAIFDVIMSEVDKIENKPTILNMPEEVCNFIYTNYPRVSRIGLMTTNGLYISGLYKNLLDKRGFDVVIPDRIFQNEIIHKMIYDPIIGIKANPTIIKKETRLLCDEALSFFKKSKVEAIILGCTELSLILKEHQVDGMLIIDSTECLAKALIKGATVTNSVKIHKL